MNIIVFGAGILGVSTAWFLRQQGHDVTVIERQSQSASETSYANGGQLSISQSEPWATPNRLIQLVKWLMQSDSPLLFRPNLDPKQWRWILGFLRECSNERFERNARAMIELGKFSRQTLLELTNSLNLEYARRDQGILCVYTAREDWKHALRLSDFFHDHGVERRVISRDEAISIEPALAKHSTSFLGATFCEEDASGDAKIFTRALTQAAQHAGVQFLFHHELQQFEYSGKTLTSATVISPEGAYLSKRADAFVLAMGSFTPRVAHRLGVYLPIYPAKGYSATIALHECSNAPKVSITDEAAKVVFSRLGDYLRVAGTAELSGYSRHLHKKRCAALIHVARRWFGDELADAPTQFWSGLRPSTPSNVACVGRLGKFENAYVNAGHGTLGWTQGVGSGRALAMLMNEGRAPVNFPFLL